MVSLCVIPSVMLSDQSIIRAGGNKVTYESRDRRGKPSHLVNPVASSAGPPSSATERQATPARQKPAHLARPGVALPTDPNAARFARGWRVNSNAPATTTSTATPSGDWTPSSPDPSTAQVDSTGWGHVHRDPYGSSIGTPSISGRNVPDDVKSAVSSTGGWGHPDEGPWTTAGAKTPKRPADKGKTKQKAKEASNGKGKDRAPPGTPKKSWADEMEEHDDSQSVVESVDGWGAVSNGPWPGAQ